MKIAYQAVLEEDDNGVFVRFPDLPEAFTEGETREEALFSAEEVLDLTLEGRMEEGMEIPEPQEHEGGIRIYPAARVQAALLMRMARGRRSLAEPARALDTSWPAAQRLENPRHSATLKHLERAVSALGWKWVLSFEPSGSRRESAESTPPRSL